MLMQPLVGTGGFIGIIRDCPDCCSYKYSTVCQARIEVAQADIHISLELCPIAETQTQPVRLILQLGISCSYKARRESNNFCSDGKWSTSSMPVYYKCMLVVLPPAVSAGSCCSHAWLCDSAANKACKHSCTEQLYRE